MNEKTLNTIANSSDIKSALEIMIKHNEEIVRIGNEKALEVIATQSIREQGPCLSTIYDKDLKQYFFGQNFKKNKTVRKQYEYWIHNDANAIIKARFLSYDDSINKGLIVLSEGKVPIKDWLDIQKFVHLMIYWRQEKLPDYL